MPKFLLYIPGHFAVMQASTVVLLIVTKLLVSKILYILIASYSISVYLTSHSSTALPPTFHGDERARQLYITGTYLFQMCIP